MHNPLFLKIKFAYQMFFLLVKTTSLAGGLLCPYKGLFPACAREAPEGFANCFIFSG
jgi:hypothetical protein